MIPAEILLSIERNRATRLFLPPTAVYALLAHPTVRQRDFASLRHFLVSAAPIAPERLGEAVDVFGLVLVQVFGQSEAPFICTVLTKEDIAAAAAPGGPRRRLASCGRPSMVARMGIMDDDGNLLPAGNRERSSSYQTWSSPATGRTRKRPLRPAGQAAGTPPATWACGTRTATTTSLIARRT